MAGKIAQMLTRLASAINPEMHRVWYVDQSGNRTRTEWCGSQEELDQAISALPEGTKIIGTQTGLHGEIL